jgi:hypothetical protein
MKIIMNDKVIFTQTGTTTMKHKFHWAKHKVYYANLATLSAFCSHNDLLLCFIERYANIMCEANP